jgi:hypothetical protein
VEDRRGEAMRGASYNTFCVCAKKSLKKLAMHDKWRIGEERCEDRRGER